MLETENHKLTSEEKKSKIRERYKGIDTDKLDFIPAIPQQNFYDESIIKRVGVYARVSTDDPRQTTSYELQKNHYEDMIKRRPNWQLVEIYADEGISGTSLKHRDSFIKMISDCEKKKLDLIVTKSVARFARNVVDCIGYVRALAAMNPPIGVFFETENIYTLDPNAEMSLSFISTLAQEESHTKSEIMNSSIEMRFRRGIFLLPVLLGYDHDEHGNLIINEQEAKIVKLCFFMYYLGHSSVYIANFLTDLKCKTKKGNVTWTPGVIISILQNERYCGDVLARKTWTPNYLDHKSRKNRQDRNQYRQKDHHKAIIPRDIFIAVQHMIMNRKYGYKSHLPNLFVISDGPLQGFVSVNPKWASFKSKNYLDASVSVYEDITQIQSRPLEFQVKPGDFDLRDYEITRAEFFETRKIPSVIFNNDKLRFSSSAIQQLNTKYIEIMLHPGKYQLIVKPLHDAERNSIVWSSDKLQPRIISGRAFLPTIYDLCGWDHLNKYKIIGTPYTVGKEKFLLFDLSDTEIMISTKNCISENMEAFYSRNYIKAYPSEWIDTFGNNYYMHGNNTAFENLDNIDFTLVPYYTDFNRIQSYTEDQLTTEMEILTDEIRTEMKYG